MSGPHGHQSLSTGSSSSAQVSRTSPLPPFLFDWSGCYKKGRERQRTLSFRRFLTPFPPSLLLQTLDRKLLTSSSSGQRSLTSVLSLQLIFNPKETKLTEPRLLSSPVPTTSSHPPRSMSPFFAGSLRHFLQSSYLGLTPSSPLAIPHHRSTTPLRPSTRSSRPRRRDGRSGLDLAVFLRSTRCRFGTRLTRGSLFAAHRTPRVTASRSTLAS